MMKTTLKNRVNTYTKIAKSVAKPTLAAVAALAAADAQAQDFVYVDAVPDIAIIKSDANVKTQAIDIVAGGATEFSFVLGDANTMPSVTLKNVGGNLVGFRAQQAGAYFYPLALSSGVPVNAGVFGNDGYNSLQNNLVAIVNDQWQGLVTAGTNNNPASTRFLGIKLNFNGVDAYGWVRIQKTSQSGSNGSWTIFDWAYDKSGAQILTGQTAALPVELTAFRAQIVANAAQLFWATASEENNAGFEVQRSEDGKNFETLNFVEGHGTTYEAQEYLFDDKSIKENTTYYYRLKQNDFDGKFEYTDVITARLESNANASAFYPNPAVGGVTKLNYNTTEGGKVNITVYNVSGQAVTELVRTVESGSNVLNLDFSTLSKGNYFVKLENGSDRQYQKLVIE